MPERAPLRVLILGGSTEASEITGALAGRADVDVRLSLAGRTAAPIDHAVPTRIGGFGGVDGLADYLRAERIGVLVDATHPFAVQISRHAEVAAQTAGVALIKVGRPAWRSQPGDRWTEVEDMAAAVASLGAAARRVFLTIGRLQLAAFAKAPQHFYLVRTIDHVGGDHGLPNAAFIAARGPFDAAAERRLMQEHRIEALITKNSGGSAAAGKLFAARDLGIPVILVRRASTDDRCGVSEAIAMIDAHCAKAPRGV